MTLSIEVRGWRRCDGVVEAEVARSWELWWSLAGCSVVEGSNGCGAVHSLLNATIEMTGHRSFQQCRRSDRWGGV